MRARYKAMIWVGLLALAGCGHSYEYERPPVGELDSRDTGLQSKELVVATDLMAQDLLALPDLNATKVQWTIVSTYMQNETMDPGMPYQIFIDRLKTNLARYGKGRVMLIENLARFQDLRSRELQTPASTPTYEPDYFLYGRMQELPNRGTSTYRAEFNLTNARTRQIVWSNEYLVKVAR